MSSEEKEPLIPKRETSFSGKSARPNYTSFHDGSWTRDGEEDLFRPTSNNNLSPVTETHNGFTTKVSGIDSGDQSSFENDHTRPAPPSLNVVGLSYIVKERPGQWWNGSCFRDYHKKTILHNLCMTFQNKELTALVGNSGSGKTSLLDIIAGRAQGDVNGVVSYKHENCTRETMRKCSSYVLQADRLLPTLTVREMLTYMAYLKLPGHYTEKQIEMKVSAVLSDMGLHNVAETRIGGAVVRGVSGGEKRRLTIGIQLLKDPEILLLDEPTSGLDAFTARHLVSSLSKLAHQGKMVIMSIHQPRSDIFNLLDKLGILTVGRLAFLGRPNQLVPYFTSIGYPCPLNQNPCDVYIDITSVDRRTVAREMDTTQSAMEICNVFANSDLQAAVIRQITSGLNYHYTESLDMDYTKKNSEPSWPRTFSTILNRMNVHLHRDRSNFAGRLMMLLFFVPFIAVFIGHFENNQGSVQDRLGCLYQCIQVPAYMGFTNSIALFPVLRDVYYRERNDGLYSTFTFMLAYFVHVLPFNIISAAMFGSALYWILGFNDGFEQFGQFLIIVIIMQQFGEMLTVSFLGVFREVLLANLTAALVLWAAGLFATGLLRSIENMPEAVQWLTYIPIHKYVAEILAYNELHKLPFTCPENATGVQCISSGDQVLQEMYPKAGDSMDLNWGMVCGYFLASWLIAAVVFKMRGVPVLH